MSAQAPNTVVGLLALVRLAAGWSPVWTHDRDGTLVVVGPRGWIEERSRRLRWELADGQVGYFRLTATGAMVALVNIGAARLPSPMDALFP